MARLREGASLWRRIWARIWRLWRAIACSCSNWFSICFLNGIEAMDPVVDRPKNLFICSKTARPETVLVEVRDSGAGLKDPDRIFEPFFTTKDNGMGMGLAICRSIIDAHRGRLWAACAEGSGTTFSFSLPVQPAAAI